mmetsp:Transcript_3330/g.11544  ORF Transcript_3330/g.11544 Transcript_3330/m.11544 type:complete len:231 (-) Transcript_3330:266-958(-)
MARLVTNPLTKDWIRLTAASFLASILPTSLSCTSAATSSVSASLSASPSSLSPRFAVRSPLTSALWNVLASSPAAFCKATSWPVSFAARSDALACCAASALANAMLACSSAALKAPSRFCSLLRISRAPGVFMLRNRRAHSRARSGTCSWSHSDSHSFKISSRLCFSPRCSARMCTSFSSASSVCSCMLRCAFSAPSCSNSGVSRYSQCLQHAATARSRRTLRLSTTSRK